MQISIDQLMNGKATRIGKRAYLPAACDYSIVDENGNMLDGRILLQ